LFRGHFSRYKAAFLGWRRQTLGWCGTSARCTRTRTLLHHGRRILGQSGTVGRRWQAFLLGQRRRCGGGQRRWRTVRQGRGVILLLVYHALCRGQGWQGRHVFGDFLGHVFFEQWGRCAQGWRRHIGWRRGWIVTRWRGRGVVWWGWRCVHRRRWRRLIGWRRSLAH
jgi:hypothetical protein